MGSVIIIFYAFFMPPVVVERYLWNSARLFRENKIDFWIVNSEIDQRKTNTKFPLKVNNRELNNNNRELSIVTNKFFIFHDKIWDNCKFW